MIDIKDARKELKRVGTAHAKGDALRFMYANLLAFEQGLSVTANSINWPIPDLYAVLGKANNDSILDLVQKIRRASPTILAPSA